MMWHKKVLQNQRFTSPPKRKKQSSIFLDNGGGGGGSDEDDDDNNNATKRNNFIGARTAVKVTPTYKKVPRRICKLLHLIWEFNWPSVMKRIEEVPSETRCITENSGRTALHLASFNQGCPINVAIALLDANSHALIVKDNDNRTPLHYACSFRGRGPKLLVPIYCNYLQTLEEKYNNINIGLQSSSSSSPITTTTVSNNNNKIVPSPLLLACRCNATLETIRVLIITARLKKSNAWVAPKTGTEPYWLSGGGGSISEDGSRKKKKSLSNDKPAKNTINKNNNVKRIGIDNSPLIALMNHIMIQQQRQHDDNNEQQDIFNNIEKESVLKALDKIDDDVVMKLPSSPDKIQKINDDEEEEKEEEDINDNDKNTVLSFIRKATLLFDSSSWLCCEGKEDDYHAPLPPSSYDGSLLHKVCSIVTPIPQLVSFFGRVMPEQALIPDSRGCVPLHHIIMSYPIPNNDNNNNFMYVNELVDIMIKINTKAGMIKIVNIMNDDNNDEKKEKSSSYPLMVAIRRGWSWKYGLAKLVEANPELLDVQDSIDNGSLYPVALAASRKDIDLTTIFELLRKAPQLCEQRSKNNGQANIMREKGMESDS